MPSGIFYSRMQPFQRDNTVLNILEGERARVLESQKAEADKMMKYRASIASGFDKMDAEGDFLKTSVGVMNKIMDDRTDMNHKYEKGEISESDLVLFMGKTGKVPSIINSAYQTFEAKQKELSDGDEFLNNDGTNALMVAAHGLEMDYDSKKEEMIVSANILNQNGKGKTRRKFTMNQWSSWVNSWKSSPKIGSVNDDVMKFSAQFRTDTEQEATSRGSQTDTGMDVGDSRKRFDEAFVARYGAPNDENNPFVRKQKGANLSYQQAYQSMYNLGVSMQPNIHKESVFKTSTASTKPTSSEKEFDKRAFTIIKDKKGENMTVIKTGGGDISGGIAVKFDSTSTDRKLDIGYNDIEGVNVPERLSRTFTVQSIYLKPDGSVWAEGTVPTPKAIEDIGKEEGISTTSVLNEMTGLDTSVQWVKLNGKGVAQIKSSLFAGDKVKNVYDKIMGVSGDNQQSVGEFDNL